VNCGTLCVRWSQGICAASSNVFEFCLGRYFGHPNRKRGEKDPRQCIWHSANDPSDDNYTAAIVVSTSSIDGICEFQTNHFVCIYYQIISRSCLALLLSLNRLDLLSTERSAARKSDLQQVQGSFVQSNFDRRWQGCRFAVESTNRAGRRRYTRCDAGAYFCKDADFNGN
jgi:hypothetical protein